ncbi:MAG: UDP-N-acetylmuramate dehydrogenase [Bacteroidales bacterium]|nr:UDP-N-acetylmuramate dehydrogenase [Bacteroidales bacterium]
MEIKKDFNLKPFNTFGVGAVARQAAVVHSVNDLHELFENGHLKNRPLLILGEGSNVLFTGDFDGLVLLNQMHGIKVVKQTDKHIFLRVNGGESWSPLVDFTVEKNWGGLENLSLIPGTAGAAPVQNIGAYGVEFKEVMQRLEAFDLQTGKVVQFENEDCEFAYRSSIFKDRHKGRYFILNITLKLSKNPDLKLEYAPLKEAFAHLPKDKVSLKQVSELVKTIRRSKLPDPEKLKNAGSFFKNPVVDADHMKTLRKTFPGLPAFPAGEQKFKLAAAWLIEQCGWKGKRLGDAGVYEKQALVLVNYGNADGKEILALAASIQQSVKKKFGIELEREVSVF